MQCSKCNNLFTYRVNLITCPNCGEILELEQVVITDLTVALKYIVQRFGAQSLANGSRAVNLLGDLAPGLKKEKQLLKRAYEAADAPIRRLITEIDQKKCLQKNVSDLVTALRAACIADRYIWLLTSSMLNTFDQDPAPYLGAKGEKLRATSKHLRLDICIDGLKAAHRSRGAALWTDEQGLLSAFQAHVPDGQDESCLLAAAYRASNGLWKQLAEAIDQHADEKLVVIRLQTAMSAEFISQKDIDFVIEAVLQSRGIAYSQQLVKSTPVSQPQQNTQTPPARKKRTVNTNTAGIQSVSSTAASPSTAAGASGSGSTPQPASKKKMGPGKILLILLAVGLAVGAMAFLIPEWIRNQQPQATEAVVMEPTQENRRYSYEDDSKDVSMTNLTLVTDTENDKYVNARDPERYFEFKGHRQEFYFRYSPTMYDDIVFTNEDQISVTFTGADGSYLYVMHDYVLLSQEIRTKEYYLEQARASMTDIDVLSSTTGFDQWMFFLKGRDVNDSTRTVYTYVSFKDYCFWTMTIKYPEAKNREDLISKEYYVHTMYALSKFADTGDELTTFQSFYEQFEG